MTPFEGMEATPSGSVQPGCCTCSRGNRGLIQIISLTDTRLLLQISVHAKALGGNLGHTVRELDVLVGKQKD